jgi:RNA polymerase sigma-70 factor (ECF subfamily)
MYLLLLNLMDGPVPEAADEELVGRMISLTLDGDDLAARRLYRMFVARVYRAVRPLTVSNADAEDVVQDTFVKALGSLHRYRRQSGKGFGAWLMTIALNTARNQSRRRRRWRPLTEDRSSMAPGKERSAEHNPMDAAMDRQRLVDLLLEALAELPERDRQIVGLRYGAELTATEVGQICGEEPATVRKICQRQRKKLLRRLALKARTSPTELTHQVQESTP